ncbi:hypothetical protein [Burkholderia pseudomallei]|uniref:hypothetical protein n=1 Tax=Burkholderia pseudomallei TaxID=28450 RepID=UPI0012F4FFA1|nr:hypothetical protein [Burkholderia pseudomallei]
MPSISSAPDERLERVSERGDGRNRDAGHEDSYPHEHDRQLTPDYDGFAGRTHDGSGGKDDRKLQKQPCDGQTDRSTCALPRTETSEAILTAQSTHWKQKNTFI